MGEERWGGEDVEDFYNHSCEGGGGGVTRTLAVHIHPHCFYCQGGTKRSFAPDGKRTGGFLVHSWWLLSATCNRINGPPFLQFVFVIYFNSILKYIKKNIILHTFTYLLLRTLISSLKRILNGTKRFFQLLINIEELLVYIHIYLNIFPTL